MNKPLIKHFALFLLLASLCVHEARAVSIEFTSPALDFIAEDGKRIALVDAGENLQFSARAIGSGMISGFQLNFENTAAPLLLHNWTQAPSWSFAFDATLQSASNDDFVAGGSLTETTLPAVLGSFQVDVPDSENDYLLTVDSESGPFSTGITNAGGTVTIDDFGDVVIRVRPAPPAIQGDYNRNGSVGPEDYAVWKSDFGSFASLHADGNNNGVIDAADYTVWRDSLGLGAGGFSVGSLTGDAANVPEPVGLHLLAVGGALTGLLRSRRIN